MNPSPHDISPGLPGTSGASRGKWLLLALLVLGMSGCANWPPEMNRKPEDVACEAGMTPADNTRLTATNQLIGDGKFYAALAQLDTYNQDAAKVRLARADALRRIDRYQQAQTLFEGLISQGCFEGRAHHGMGLLLARQGRLDAGLEHLRQARTKLPTDGRIRGDLGYALMLSGQLDDARFEMLTALDLDPRDGRTSRNLVLLTLKQGGETKAQELGKKLGLDEATMDRLRKQASELNPPPLTKPALDGGAQGEP